MIDVVHSVSLDCPQYFPTPTGTFPATTPTSLHSSVQQHIDFNSASLGDFDLTGEQLIARLNLLDPASLFAMAFQPTQLFHLSGLSGQEDSQSSESTPSSHTEIYDSAMLQSNMTPSFVEPSTNYFALPATSAPTYYNGYNNNNSSSLTTLPTSSAMALTGATSTNNLSSVSSRTNPGYVENYPAPQPHHGHHGHHHHHHHLEHNPHASRVGMSNPQLIVPPSHHYYQREVYQGSVPSSIGRISRQHNPVQNHHPKPISVSIGTGHSSHRQPNNLAAAIASPIFVAPTYNINNINSGGNNTMHLPLFESNNSGSPSAINNSTAAQSPETTTKTTPTYSYSGPPKSYYSRLPLYDRPFKCDQCPQSFNRNHDLKRHKRIHLAVKPYPCPCCEKQFSRKDALKRHILVKGCTKKVTPTTTSNKVGDKSSIEKYDPSPIESYVDTISQPKTEPTEYGMSI